MAVRGKAQVQSQVTDAGPTDRKPQFCHLDPPVIGLLDDPDQTVQSVQGDRGSRLSRPARGRCLIGGRRLVVSGQWLVIPAAHRPLPTGPHILVCGRWWQAQGDTAQSHPIEALQQDPLLQLVPALKLGHLGPNQVRGEGGPGHQCGQVRAGQLQIDRAAPMARITGIPLQVRHQFQSGVVRTGVWPIQGGRHRVGEQFQPMSQAVVAQMQMHLLEPEDGPAQGVVDDQDPAIVEIEPALAHEQLQPPRLG